MDMLDELLRLTRRLQLARGERVQPLCWRPAADVYRTREGWLVKLEVAGVRDEEIELSASGRLLTIRGRRRDLVLIEGCECHSLEILYSQFERTVELPIALAQVRMRSEYRDGMLMVRVITEESGHDR
jgi:HSP20 family protein